MRAVTTLPPLFVEVDDSELDTDAARALGAVLVEQRLSLPTLCELTFYDPVGPLADAQTLLPGSALKLTVEDCDVPLFVGEITAVEYGYGPSGGRETRVRGYDLLHRLRKEQPVRHFAEMTLADLAGDLVSGLPITVEIQDKGPVWPKVVQWRQPSLEVLTEVSERCGLLFRLCDDKLQFLSFDGIGDAVPLEFGEGGLEVKIDVNTDPACRSVETLGWDPWRAKYHLGRASEPRSGRDIEIEATPDLVGASGERTLADVTVQSDEQADCLAQAELDRRVAGEVTLWAIADGDPQLRPGTPIELNGVAPALSGRYVPTSVRHTIDREHGFLSELETVPPQPSPRRQTAISTLGVVTDVDDPDGLGRVRVSLPNHGGIDSDWFEVLTPGAGQDKGLVTLPDRKDRVLVLLTQEDPAQGIVLGGLYGETGPPDDGVEEGAVQRYTLVTPGGQCLRLDDEKKRVRLENSSGDHLQLSPGRVRLRNNDGSFVELSRKEVRIHADTDLVIEAPGKCVTIRAASIELETG